MKTNRIPDSACAYVRVSTDAQDNSIKAQNHKLAGYVAIEKLQLPAERIFGDDDTCGEIPIIERPGGRALMKLILDRHGPQHLIVAKLDRLGRDAIDIQQTWRHLVRDLGVTVHILDLGGATFSSDAPIAEFLVGARALMAQFEVRLIRERIKDTFESMRERGAVTGTVPFGWDDQPTGETRERRDGSVIALRRLVPNTVEQHWLLEMKRLRDAGMSHKDIACWLNEQGARTKSGKQGAWTHGTVAKVLQSKHAGRLFAARARTTSTQPAPSPCHTPTPPP